jgi:coenzyme F420-reducing hydrogenase gamma subunit
MTPGKPKLGVWKFASCDGCQLSLLDCEEELLAVVGVIDIADFREATSFVMEGPYDVSLVEGSITTSEDEQRIQEIRRQSKLLVAIGACATAGGIQGLKNFGDVEDYRRYVYQHPEAIHSLPTSTAIKDHVKVDLELRGCPISKAQLLDAVSSIVYKRAPNLPTETVCVECKRRGNVCVMVGYGTPCLGPVTQTGCGAICPSFHRGCYGCFGPQDTPNTASLSKDFKAKGMPQDGIVRFYRTFNANAREFRMASEAAEGGRE